MDEIPIPIVLLIILGAVLVLLLSISCCAVRCFRPQNSRGPDWFVRRDGKQQLVKAPFRDDRDPNNDSRNWLRLKQPINIPPAALEPLPTPTPTPAGPAGV
jgi:hypothetical protein